MTAESGESRSRSRSSSRKRASKNPKPENTGPAAVYVEVARLRPWAKNPRKNDEAVDAVAKSIERFGFGAPLLARVEDGELIAGHTRLKAAIKLGLPTVPVRYLDISEHEAHLMAIADNKLGELADWDEAMLASQLAEQSAADIAVLGFSGAASSVMRPGAAAYVCHSDQNPGLRPAFEDAFVASGFKLASCIVWVKASATMGWQDYRNQYEPILYGWREGADRMHVTDRTQTTVWEIGRDAASSYQHPTQKPVELPSRAIRNSSRDGANVLDPFGGSGSTLLACERLGRRCFTMEKAPHYADVILSRWEAMTGEVAVLDGSEG